MGQPSAPIEEFFAPAVDAADPAADGWVVTTCTKQITTQVTRGLLCLVEVAGDQPQVIQPQIVEVRHLAQAAHGVCQLPHALLEGRLGGGNGCLPLTSLDRGQPFPLNVRLEDQGVGPKATGKVDHRPLLPVHLQHIATVQVWRR
jgi:hypothetical protein